MKRLETICVGYELSQALCNQYESQVSTYKSGKVHFQPLECQTCWLQTCQTSHQLGHTHICTQNDDNGTGEMNQIRQNRSAQGLAQQTVLVEHMMKLYVLDMSYITSVQQSFTIDTLSSAMKKSPNIRSLQSLCQHSSKPLSALCRHTSKPLLALCRHTSKPLLALCRHTSKLLLAHLTICSWSLNAVSA